MIPFQWKTFIRLYLSLVQGLPAMFLHNLDVIFFEGKMHERSQFVKEQKAVKLKELKDEMMKAEKKKQEEKEKETEEDWNIAQEQQEIEKRKIEQENVLRYLHMSFVITYYSLGSAK